MRLSSIGIIPKYKQKRVRQLNSSKKGKRNIYIYIYIRIIHKYKQKRIKRLSDLCVN